MLARWGGNVLTVPGCLRASPEQGHLGHPFTAAVLLLLYCLKNQSPAERRGTLGKQEQGRAEMGFSALLQQQSPSGIGITTWRFLRCYEKKLTGSLVVPKNWPAWNYFCSPRSHSQLVQFQVQRAGLQKVQGLQSCFLFTQSISEVNSYNKLLNPFPSNLSVFSTTTMTNGVN